MKIKLLVKGGDLKPGPVLSQKIGPLGIPMGNIIQKVNEATKNFKGMRVPVELDINPTTKEFSTEVSSPPVSELLKKEIGLEKGSGEQDKAKAANASIEQIISVAKTKLPDMLSKDLKAAVKTVVGSAVSLGVLIENKDAKEIEEEIQGGKYDQEISEEKTDTPEDKKAKLKKFFEVRKTKQEKDLKAEQEAAEAEKTKSEESEESKESMDKESEEKQPESPEAPKKA